MLKVWEREGKIPPRNINHVAVNLDEQVSRSRLEERIRIWLRKQTSFIFIEGVIFLLNEHMYILART